jgi:formyl-CoA transferase
VTDPTPTETRLPPKTALSGIRVLDLGRVLAAPFAAQVLADLGAEVIKIERPDGGDDTRAWKPPVSAGNSAYFGAVNRNKRSVTLDFGSEQGREVFYNLVSKSDVVIQNFRPGVTERLGIDYETVKPYRPDIIYCSISGFGQEGPLSRRAAYDYIVQAYSGLMSLTGEVDGDPVRCAGAVADYGSGMWSVIGILYALMERQRTGKGQHIDLSMLDCTLTYVNHLASQFMAGGDPPERVANGHASIAPMDVYKTQDGPLMVVCGNDGMFKRLAQCLGAPELAEDPRFAKNADRAKNLGELQELVRSLFATDTQKSWEKRLSEADIPVAPVRTIPEVMAADEMRDRSMIIELTDAEGQPVRLVGSPLKMSESAVAAAPAIAPRLAQHTREVLMNLGGLSQERLDELVKQGVVTTE